tara:strand:+ start:11944 stop:13443 length:1500 start_codon:yes stop_codon:yes gene_type:complete
MAIKRYIADQDNTITNAYKANLTSRGVSGNMGQSDIIEVFTIYGQESSTSSELCRSLVQFPVDTIATDRTNGDIPASGSVSFYLRLFNAEQSQTTPRNFILSVNAVSLSWAEGLGLDMEEYSDIGASNWITASSSPIVKWATEGGDYYTDASSSFSQSFDTGLEDMELDISSLVEQWISASNGSVASTDDLGSKTNFGVGIQLTASQEDETTSYYTKKFFARGSQYYFKRPILEARWDSSKQDDRNNMYLSSSMVPASDNLMKLYLYNIVRGQLTNIPVIDTGDLLVSLYSGTLLNAAPSGSKIGLALGGGTVADGDLNTTASYVEAGIYSCSFAYTSSAITTIFDVWHRPSDGLQYHTGSGMPIKTYNSADFNFDQKYVSNITNLRDIYSTQETTRFRLYVRKKNWSPNIYTVASNAIPNTTIANAYYRISRVSDDFKVVPYGTGSTNQTKMSYDVSGSYFDFDMSMLETDTVYAINLAYKINGKYVQQPEEFRFRVE